MLSWIKKIFKKSEKEERLEELTEAVALAIKKRGRPKGSKNKTIGGKK